MGLPVDSPDRNDDAHKYEQHGEDREEEEGDGGESQTEASTRPLLLPINKKKRKNKKRYFTAGSPPFDLFPIAGVLPDSYEFVTCSRRLFPVFVFSLVLIVLGKVDERNETFVGPRSKADVCPSFCLSSLSDDCGSTSPTANTRAVRPSQRSITLLSSANMSLLVLIF